MSDYDISHDRDAPDDPVRQVHRYTFPSGVIYVVLRCIILADGERGDGTREVMAADPQHWRIRLAGRDTLDSPRTAMEVAPLTEPTRQDFENLLAFRVALRRFQRWSEDQAGAVGLTHVQHQLLVAIKGHPGSAAPSVGQIADYLLLQSHSAVGLVDRAEAAGFVRRCPDPDDARVARVELTETGDRLVTGLTETTLTEMHNLAAALNTMVSAGQETG